MEKDIKEKRAERIKLYTFYTREFERLKEQLD
jgi:hypothetical protein